ncbi:MAG: hypothetical protein H0U82_06790 [Actinobacteria bacterium]|nr:hypothetical protein [Actinomycetota bacterium]
MPQLNALGIVASDMARSIAFYRLLGLDVLETPDEGHVDMFQPNGVRFMLDTEETVQSFRAEWTREPGNQVGLALECESPAEVDDVYARAVAVARRVCRGSGESCRSAGRTGCRTAPAPSTPAQELRRRCGRRASQDHSRTAAIGSRRRRCVRYSRTGARSGAPL